MISVRPVQRRVAVALVFALFTLLPAFGQQEPACTVRITLLQVNDVYQFTPVEGGKRGGLARVSALRKKIMADSPHTLFLLAGDTISPSVESITYKGRQMIDAWNLSGLDFATFGNHEFDFGPEVLRERIGESKFKWLGANVVDKTSGQTFANTSEFIIREFEGVKIGFFGLTLPETKVTSRPGDDVDILDPCTTATRIVPQIRARGAQVVIALTHLSMQEDKQLARCSGVDLILGGHEHSLLESMAGHAPILKMTADAREMGRIDLNISKTTGQVQSIDWKVIEITDELPSDTQFVALERKYGSLLNELARRVGHTNVELEARSGVGRTRETNTGDFVADAFRNATLSDVAIMNGGSIRADDVLKPGDLTRRDVLSLLPFKNRVIKMELSGATLRAALEHGVARSAEDAEPGRFPQVSGMRYVFDATRKPGSRITSLTVNGRPLDDRKTYTLATTDYVAGGGDGYEMLKSGRLLIAPAQGQFDSDVLQKAISSVRAIAPKTDGRITRLDKPAGKKNDCAER
ncbi:MAG: 5-nucleotidase / UDP-sugar diphosphatase [Blastocatellia bacterium]|jgi:5'-nucleotidase|nr:5-nucleotidase / UDP-sugar diphosphatase [Blastocatellia bacterium]